MSETSREMDIDAAFRRCLPPELSHLPLSPAEARSEQSLAAAWSAVGEPLTWLDFCRIMRTALKTVYNCKYGDWGTVNDLRNLFRDDWMEPIRGLIERLDPPDVLVVGANDGREVEALRLPSSTRLHLIDLSHCALDAAASRLVRHPNLTLTCNAFQDVAGLEGSSSLVLSLRTVNSSSVVPEEFTDAACLATRSGGTTILSVANGYQGEDGAVVGLRDTQTGRIDPQMPHTIAQRVRERMALRDYAKYHVMEGRAEIFVVAQGKR